MYLDCAVFENFRNIEHFPFSFDKGINILFGNNAQGKTNVIEGLYLFGTGKSFRHARDKDLIMTGKRHTQVSIAYVDSIRENKMALRLFDNSQKEMFRNGIKLGKMSGFIGNFRAVLFCPEHLAIVKSEPAERRSFLDHALSQFDYTYLAALMDHKKILEQRNALLRNFEEKGDSARMTLEILSEKLAEAAAVITEIRAKYLARLFLLVNRYLSEMTGGREKASVKYLSHIMKDQLEELFDRNENLSRYRAAMARHTEKEIILGTTVSGAHRDDFEILLNDKNAKIFASQGQQRSISLAMKLAEGEISKEVSGEYPVFLLDDVLSELDRDRKRYILSELRERQVILTSCDESDFGGIGGAVKIYVENGTYTYC